ncbi:hypothetical protein ACLBWP_02185 [Microbacterium sp. M1A1_1b]
MPFSMFVGGQLDDPVVDPEEATAVWPSTARVGQVYLIGWRLDERQRVDRRGRGVGDDPRRENERSGGADEHEVALLGEEPCHVGWPDEYAGSDRDVLPTMDCSLECAAFSAVVVGDADERDGRSCRHDDTVALPGLGPRRRRPICG